MRNSDVEIVNLTPHPVVIQKVTGEKIEIPPSGIVARVKEERIKVGEINGIPIYAMKYGEVENLPEPRKGVVYIVSSVVLPYTKGRTDVFAPDTGRAIRDEKGNIVAVCGLIRREE